jgi:hypothetical protein
VKGAALSRKYADDCRHLREGAMTDIDPNTLLQRKPLSEALTAAGFPAQERQRGPRR